MTVRERWKILEVLARLEPKLTYLHKCASKNIHVAERSITSPHSRKLSDKIFMFRLKDVVDFSGPYVDQEMRETISYTRPCQRHLPYFERSKIWEEYK
jgi:hypothetical protein